MLSFGTYPTPVRLLDGLSRGETALYIKHDDRTNPLYGGNKVRKIGPLLEDAKRHGAHTVLTIGAIGSHHILTTGIFAKTAGLRVEAVVVGQPETPHVLETLRAVLAQGVRLFPASSYAHAVALLLARRARSGVYYIPAGGSNTIGAQGFVDAASELLEQVTRGELPEPDLIVVPVGSGGTAAGLAAGLAKASARTRVLAVTVAEPAWFVEHQLHALARRCARRVGAGALRNRLEVTREFLGGGYGHVTPEGAQATRLAEGVGVQLDPTYTAKAFAATCARVALGRERTILYWHTLSSAPLGPLLGAAADPPAIDAKLRRLARSAAR